MKHQTKRKYPLLVLASAVGLIVLLFGFSLSSSGRREVGVLENVDGIPFAVHNGVVQVTERLAHADIYLKEPVLAKQLELDITFDPANLEQLDVAVRENAFWLSYPTVVLYSRQVDTSQKQSKRITIPLSDKFQETDQSIDIMFFATTTPVTDAAAKSLGDTSSWELYNVYAGVKVAQPTKAQLRNYIGSIIRRERAQ